MMPYVATLWHRHTDNDVNNIRLYVWDIQTRSLDDEWPVLDMAYGTLEFSPDGKWLAITAGIHDGSDIISHFVVIDVSTKEIDTSWPVLGQVNDFDTRLNLVRWARNSRKLAVTSHRSFQNFAYSEWDVSIIDVPTRRVETTLPTSTFSGLPLVCDWSPDGTLFAVGHREHPYLTVLRTDTMTTDPGWPSQGSNVWDTIEFSPDGQWLAVGNRPFGSSSSGSVIINTATKQFDDDWPTDWRWSSSTNALHNPPTRLSWSPDGKWLVATQPGSTPSWMIDAETKQLASRARQNEPNTGPWTRGTGTTAVIDLPMTSNHLSNGQEWAWSPDGSRLFARYYPAGGQWLQVFDPSVPDWAPDIHNWEQVPEAQGELHALQRHSISVSGDIAPVTVTPDLRIAGRDANTRVGSFGQTLQDSPRVGPGSHW